LPNIVKRRIGQRAGDGVDDFRKNVFERNLEDRVVIVERSSRVENYVQACEAGIYSSEKESFCLGILETMFGGIPSVAFAIGGIPEVTVDGETGLLSPFGDTNELAAAIDRLVDDPEFAADLGRNALKRAEYYFAAEKVVPQYLDLYYRLLS